MELNPKLRLRRPIDVPFSNPKSITVCPSIALVSKKCKRCATWRVQNVTIRCQLVNVVAAYVHKQDKLSHADKYANLVYPWFFVIQDPLKHGNTKYVVVVLTEWKTKCAHESFVADDNGNWRCNRECKWPNHTELETSWHLDQLVFLCLSESKSVKSIV